MHLRVFLCFVFLLPRFFSFFPRLLPFRLLFFPGVHRGLSFPLGREESRQSIMSAFFLSCAFFFFHPPQSRIETPWRREKSYLPVLFPLFWRPEFCGRTFFPPLLFSLVDGLFSPFFPQVVITLSFSFLINSISFPVISPLFPRRLSSSQGRLRFPPALFFRSASESFFFLEHFFFFSRRMCP